MFSSTRFVKCHPPHSGHKYARSAARLIVAIANAARCGSGVRQMALFLALFIRLASGQCAIGLRRLHFGAPVAPNDLNCLLSIVDLHLAQFISAIAAVGGAAFAFVCCVVITIATEPIIKPAATAVRKVKFSPANIAPSNTATIGFT